MNNNNTRSHSIQANSVALSAEVQGVHNECDAQSADETVPTDAEQGILEGVFLDDDGSLVNAHKYRPSKHLNVALCLGGLLVLVITLAGVFGGSSKSAKPEPTATTMAPTSSTSLAYYNRDPTDIQDITNTLTNQLGSTYFENSVEITGFPYQMRQKALNWLLYQDPLQFNASNDHLLQRFILSLFYFHTTRHHAWEECNPPVDQQSELCFEPSGGYYGDDHTSVWGHRWLSGFPECMWAGILCDRNTKQVASLRLSFNDLNGPIPWELASLTKLAVLSLNVNDLTGIIPPELGHLTLLNGFELNSNRLSGTIPTELFARGPGDAALVSLLLSNNALTGSIPTEIGLMNGTRIQLVRNDLTGTLPLELFQASNMMWLFLSGNAKITGSLPTEIGLMSDVSYMHIGYTGLTGSVPSEFGLLSHLSDFNATNTALQGTLPEESYRGLKAMEYLDISECRFSGTLSTSLGLLRDLRVFHIDHNKFSGTLPTEMAALAKLRSLELNENNLSGSIPEEVCLFSEVENDWMEFELVADCMPDASTGVAAIECPGQCCTSCCSSETGICTLS